MVNRIAYFVPKLNDELQNALIHKIWDKLSHLPINKKRRIPYLRDRPNTILTSFCNLLPPNATYSHPRDRPNISHISQNCSHTQSRDRPHFSPPFFYCIFCIRDRPDAMPMQHLFYSPLFLLSKLPKATYWECCFSLK